MLIMNVDGREGDQTERTGVRPPDLLWCRHDLVVAGHADVRRRTRCWVLDMTFSSCGTGGNRHSWGLTGGAAGREVLRSRAPKSIRLSVLHRRFPEIVIHEYKSVKSTCIRQRLSRFGLSSGMAFLETVSVVEALAQRLREQVLDGAIPAGASVAGDGDRRGVRRLAPHREERDHDARAGGPAAPRRPPLCICPDARPRGRASTSIACGSRSRSRSCERSQPRPPSPLRLRKRCGTSGACRMTYPPAASSPPICASTGRWSSNMARLA